MKENKDSNFEKLVGKMMKSDRLEKPSADFSFHVMEQIESLQKSKATVYKPLISKPVWYVIGLSMVVLVVFVFLGNGTETETWMPTVNYNALFHNNFMNSLSRIKFSSTLMYTMVFFVLMLGVQIPMIKNFYDKHLN